MRYFKSLMSIMLVTVLSGCCDKPGETDASKSTLKSMMGSAIAGEHLKF